MLIDKYDSKLYSIQSSIINFNNNSLVFGLLLFEIRTLVIQLTHRAWLVLRLISDLLFDCNVVWEFNATASLLLVVFFVDLDDAYHWLSVDLWVVIDDNV